MNGVWCLFFNCRSCHGGLGHHKPQRGDWLRAAPRREDPVFGECSSSIHPVAAFSGPVTFFFIASTVSWIFYPLLVPVLADWPVPLIQVGRTLSRFQQAFSWSYGEEIKPFKPPLSDAEFHHYLNGQGQLTRPEELRLRIYHGGVEPSLRKVPVFLISPQISISHKHG